MEAYALGFWDELGDGLSNTHELGLYTLAGTLLSRAMTLGGTGLDSVSLAGAWRFFDITRIVLSPGSYVLAATFAAADTDPPRAQAQVFAHPAITYVRARSASGASLVFPVDDQSTYDAGFFGANLRLRPPAARIPTSTTGGWIGLAALLLTIVLWCERGVRRSRLVANSTFAVDAD